MLTIALNGIPILGRAQAFSNLNRGGHASLRAVTEVPIHHQHTDSRYSG